MAVPSAAVSAPKWSAFGRIRSWWTPETLSRQFWIFFLAALFFDFGFGLFFFLFNLFLANSGFDERAIGIISSAFTLGSVAGTLPVGILVRRFGLRRLLLFCFVATPVVSICRAWMVWRPAEIVLAFLAGVALCSWPVCFAPTVAKLTDESNRVFAFSISFATGIGAGTVSGLIGGWLPGLLHSTHKSGSVAGGMEIVLIGSSLLVTLGVWPILRLDLGRPDRSQSTGGFPVSPYLLRFLPVFALWNVVTGSFIPFASIFFQKRLGMPLADVGILFSACQLAQFCAVLIAPQLTRRAGAPRAIILAQIVSALAMVALRFSHAMPASVAMYLVFAAMQFSCGPGLYGLLMSRVPEGDRSSASAVQNITGSLTQAGTVAVTGWLIVRQGYSFVFAADACLAALVAVLASVCLLPASDSPIEIRKAE